MQNTIKSSAAVHELSCAQAFFTLSRNGKESENPVLWPWPLTYDHEILWVSSECHAAENFIKLCAAVCELSCAQRKKTLTKTIRPVATAWPVTSNKRPNWGKKTQPPGRRKIKPGIVLLTTTTTEWGCIHTHKCSLHTLKDTIWIAYKMDCNRTFVKLCTQWPRMLETRGALIIGR